MFRHLRAESVTDFRPIFIVGAPRSGTTLLQRLLEPVVAVPPETHYVRRFWLARRRFGDLTDQSSWTQLQTAIEAVPEYAESGLGPGSLDHAERSHRGVLQAWLEGFAADTDRRPGEKTPNHAMAIDLLASWFPEATFVHIIRDPRDVVASTGLTPWTTGFPAGDANVWRQYNRAVRRSTARRSGRVVTVVYERLVSMPGDVLSHLCAQLGLEFDQSMLDIEDRPAVGLDLDREPWKGGVASSVTTDSVGRWHGLERATIIEIEAVTRQEMRRWGYEPTTTPLQGVGPVARRSPRLIALQGAAALRGLRM